MVEISHFYVKYNACYLNRMSRRGPKQWQVCFYTNTKCLRKIRNKIKKLEYLALDEDIDKIDISEIC